MGQNANQPPPLTDYNLWRSDVPLREAVEREGAGFIAARAESWGERLGREEIWRFVCADDDTKKTGVHLGVHNPRTVEHSS